MKVIKKEVSEEMYYITEYDLFLKVNKKIALYRNDKKIFDDDIEDIFSYEVKYNYLLYGKNNNVYIYDFNKMQIIDVIYNTKIENISLKGNGLIFVNGKLDYVKGANEKIILDYIPDIKEYYFYENYDIIKTDKEIIIYLSNKEIKRICYIDDVSNISNIRFFKNLIAIIGEDTILINTKTGEIINLFEYFDIVKYDTQTDIIVLLNNISLVVYDLGKEQVINNYIIHNNPFKSFVNYQNYFLIYGAYNSLSYEFKYNLYNLETFEFEFTDLIIELYKESIHSFEYYKDRTLILYLY